MTQRVLKCIIKMVRTSLFAIAFYFSFVFFLSVESAHAFGGFMNRLRGEQSFGVAHDRRASPRETHGGVSCPSGSCGDNSLRAGGPQALPTGSPLSAGVNRTLVNLYRSCDAVRPLTDIVTTRNGRVALSYDQARRNYFLNSSGSERVSGIDTVRTVYDGGEVVRAGPYARHVANAQCPNPVVNGSSVDAQTTPVIFQNGATLGYTPGQGLNPYGCIRSRTNGYCNMGPESQPAVALDCMEFVTTSMASACLKFTEDDNFSNPNAQFLNGNLYVSNRQVARSLNSSDSCFDRINLNSANFLQEGDLIFGSQSPNHAVIITDVGPDPFGIQGLGNRRCDSLSPRDFNFSLAQSTSTASLGPSKIEASDFFCFYNRNIHINENRGCARGGTYDVPFPLQDILQRAIQVCRHVREGRSLPAASINPNYHFVRHNGTPACRMSDDECPSVIGDECADDVCRVGRGS